MIPVEIAISVRKLQIDRLIRRNAHAGGQGLDVRLNVILSDEVDDFDCPVHSITIQLCLMVVLRGSSNLTPHNYRAWHQPLPERGPLGERFPPPVKIGEMGLHNGRLMGVEQTHVCAESIIGINLKYWRYDSIGLPHKIHRRFEVRNREQALEARWPMGILCPAHPLENYLGVGVCNDRRLIAPQQI